MKNLKLTAVMLCSSVVAMAGGLVTNTNQNVAFLRNPCRDAAIGIDGVYSNPAGVLFLGEGLHLSINIQNAHQTRTITSTFGGFAYGINNGGQTRIKFEGKADAPVVPSIQAAYNKKRWSFQAGFSITGGGGKCEFSDGLGSFESVVSMIPMLANAQGMNITGYDYDSYLKGRQYYFGLQLGSAYRLTDNISVYGGVRFMYGSCNYHGYLRDIDIQVDGNVVSAPTYFSGLYQQALQGAQQYADAAALYAEQGDAQKAGALAVATKDITLNCDQQGFGAAPVIGVDIKAGCLNFAVKYDFKTRMRLENVSANSESASNIAMLEKYADGKIVAEDSPALLTAGVQWTVIEPLRISVGYHHFFDKQAKQYADKQKELDGGTNEFMGGVEYDICKRLQVSCGVQSTNYQFTDSYMNDISFNVSSYTLGGGFGINVTDKIKVNVAYFQTNYQTYHKKTNDYNNLSSLVGSLAGQSSADALVMSGALAGADDFTRTNRVLGLGIDFRF